ncbi:M23 family metallopeptidase [Streptomyces sp. 2A115]|uniref:M23 family metallopeptidase n=1 Tax=Streptomyces sp. 2A115 TaxID=3457439 RepID=UPI003FD4AB44
MTAPDGTQTWYVRLASARIRSGFVQAGTVISYAGSTGNSSGPHLHRMAAHLFGDGFHHPGVTVAQQENAVAAAVDVLLAVGVEDPGAVGGDLHHPAGQRGQPGTAAAQVPPVGAEHISRLRRRLAHGRRGHAGTSTGMGRTAASPRRLVSAR